MPNSWKLGKCLVCGELKSIRRKSMLCATCNMKRNEVAFFPRACAHSEAAITDTGISYVVQCSVTLMPDDEDFCSMHISHHFEQLQLIPAP